MSFPLRSMLVGCPIGAGHHPVVLNLKLRRNEDVVNAAVGHQIRIETVERAVLRKALPGISVGVFQDIRLGKCLVDFVILVNIEIAR